MKGLSKYRRGYIWEDIWFFTERDWSRQCCHGSKKSTCRSVSFVIYISGAKSEEHCSNISGDILDWLLYCFSPSAWEFHPLLGVEKQWASKLRAANIFDYFFQVFFNQRFDCTYWKFFIGMKEGQASPNVTSQTEANWGSKTRVLKLPNKQNNGCAPWYIWQPSFLSQQREITN